MRIKCAVADGLFTIAQLTLQCAILSTQRNPFYVDYDTETFMTDEKLESISAILRRQKFVKMKLVVSGNGLQKHSLLIFDKTEKPLKAE